MSPESPLRLVDQRLGGPAHDPPAPAAPTPPAGDPPRLPWFKFYPASWQGDELLGMCSLAARGLLTELTCIMHRARPYGHLLVNGRQPTDAELSRLVRCASIAEVRRLRGELLDGGVLSRHDDGTIYSRRMVREGEKSAAGRAAGLRGGNPALTLNRDPYPRPLRVGDNTQSTEDRGQNPRPPAGALVDDDLATMAAEFLRHYPEVYRRCRSGAFYRVKEVRDFPVAVELVRDYQPLDRLLNMLEVFLRRTDTKAMGTPGTPRQFAHFAPDCDRVLKEHGR